MNKRSILSAISIGLCLSSVGGVLAPTPASAQVIVHDPLTFIQREKQNLASTIALYNQFVVLKNQFTEAQKLTKQLGAPGAWSSASQSLANLTQALDASINLTDASTNLAKGFDKAFPTAGGGAKYAERYSQMANTQLAKTRQALIAAGMQPELIKNEQGVMDGLEKLSDGSIGHLQAIQAGNKIALMGIAQMQQMRTLISTEMGQQAAYNASHVANEASDKDLVRQMWGGPPKPAATP